MIRFEVSDILTADVEALVNTVNCVGVMGRGIALGFKQTFPENFEAYAKACADGDLRPGRMFVYNTQSHSNPHYIINFPTKRHWREFSRIEDIDAGLEDLVKVIRALSIGSIAAPPLGCGQGGLLWDDVRPRIHKSLSSIDGLDAVIFEPSLELESLYSTKQTKQAKMTPARAVLILLMKRYLDLRLDPFITTLEVHKLTYFMQVAGEKLKLDYAPHHYGPYAKNLRHLLEKINGSFITGFESGKDGPHTELDIVPGAADKAEELLNQAPATNKRFARVTELVYGFESAFGLELLSTVHWVIEHARPNSMDALVTKIYAWGPRKKRFSRRQIELAAQVLKEKGWLSHSFNAMGGMIDFVP